MTFSFCHVVFRRGYEVTKDCSIGEDSRHESHVADSERH